MPQNITFIANIARLEGLESYDFVPGYTLRKATPEEIHKIKENVRLFLPYPQMLYDQLWEGALPQNRFPQNILPADQWRYFIISFSGDQNNLGLLNAAFLLSPIELDMLFTLSLTEVPNQYSIAWNKERQFRLFQEIICSPDYFVNINSTNLEMIRTIYSRIVAHGNNQPDIKRVTSQLLDLKGLPTFSPLRFLGYFGLLEAVLTHSPKLTDPYDSIGRQIKNKIVLLNNRLNPRIDYSPFGEATPETIWSKMYSYRSKLAHGDPVNFSNDFQVLINYESALCLIKETVKAITRQTLIEPTLLIDLKNC